MNLREARFLFPALKEKVFLDSGAVGLMPEPAVKAVNELVDFASQMQGPDTRSIYAGMVGRRRQATRSIAKLIGAKEDEIVLVNQLGIERVEDHIQALVDQLHRGLDDLGVKVVSPRERDRRAGIVTFRVYHSPKRDWELVRKLINGNIVVSMRYTSGVGGIRASVHYFNNEGDIDRLIESISGLK